MRKMDIAMVLIKQGDNYLLQHRNGDPKIGAARLIGCFGGKVSKDELPIEAASRELDEETTLFIEPSQLKELGSVAVISDHKHKPVEVVAHVFGIEIDDGIKVEATEGELVKMNHEQVFKTQQKLTPATKATFKEIVGWL